MDKVHRRTDGQTLAEIRTNGRTRRGQTDGRRLRKRAGEASGDEQLGGLTAESIIKRRSGVKIITRLPRKNSHIDRRRRDRETQRRPQTLVDRQHRLSVCLRQLLSIRAPIDNHGLLWRCATSIRSTTFYRLPFLWPFTYGFRSNLEPVPRTSPYETSVLVS